MTHDEEIIARLDVACRLVDLEDQVTELLASYAELFPGKNAVPIKVEFADLQEVLGKDGIRLAIALCRAVTSPG